MEIENKIILTAWEEYIRVFKKYVIITAIAIMLSMTYNAATKIDFGPASGKVMSSYLSPNVGIVYEYNAREDKITTRDDFLDSMQIIKGSSKIATDIATNSEELEKLLSENIGDRTTKVDPNHAFNILRDKINIEDNTIYIDLDIENKISETIKDLKMIIVVHGDGNVYLEIPFDLNGVNIEPYQNYSISLAKDVEGYQDKIPTKSNVSIVGGYMR